MKRNFYRLFHILTPILVGLNILGINRFLSIVGNIVLLISTFTFDEQHSGLTVRYKILQDFSIVAGVLLLGALIFKSTFYLFCAGIFLLCLHLEWKFHLFSKRWEET